jgi:hypothetical protein
MSMKNSGDTIGNQTRDLPACSAVPQPTAPPRAAENNYPFDAQIEARAALSIKITSLAHKRFEFEVPPLRWNKVLVVSIKPRLPECLLRQADISGSLHISSQLLLIRFRLFNVQRP